MKNLRKSIIVTPKMNEEMKELSKRWGVSEGEVVRRIFGIGVLIFGLVNKLFIFNE